MLNFNISPFNTLPLNGTSLFNLTCDYLISLFEKINRDYHKLFQHASELTLQLTNPNSDFDFEASKDFVFQSESVIDTYSRIVKCVKLSLGSNVGNALSKHTVFQSFSYSPNQSLQHIIVHGLRNTQQHFEERLQNHNTRLDPFIQISYAGLGKQWKIIIGSEGFRSSGSSNGQEENFNIDKLLFHSYTQEQKNLKPCFVSIGEIWTDTLKMIELVKDNMQEHLTMNGSCNCPRFTYLGVIVSPYND